MRDAAHAYWLRAPGLGEIRPVALPEPGRGDVVVRTLRSGVSRGTETLVFRGGVPPGQYATMRAPFQEGEFPGPVKYGIDRVIARAFSPARTRATISRFARGPNRHLPSVMSGPPSEPSVVATESLRRGPDVPSQPFSRSVSSSASAFACLRSCG